MVKNKGVPIFKVNMEFYTFVIEKASVLNAFKNI